MSLDSLETKEVFDMLQQNGIDISFKKLKELFKIIDTKNKGSLNLEEFKEFAFSEKANESTSIQSLTSVSPPD